MIVKKDYEIATCDDMELNIQRESKLEFKLWFDDAKETKALVFINQGLGADCNDPYLDFIARDLIKNLNIAIIGVNYHCIGNRPQTGSSFYLDDIDKLILNESCKAIHLKLPMEVKEINTHEKMSEVFHFINQSLAKAKFEGKLNPNYFLNLHVSLQPSKNEYQNFGIIQAQDLINALLFIKANSPFEMTGGGDLPVIMIGSSHGGYLANLAAKIAPWLVDGVIDNSSGAKFLWRVVGFGKEIDFMQYAEFSTFDFFHHINTHCSTKTFWTSNKEAKNFFSPARRKIRNILEKDHLLIQSKYPTTKYIGYHSHKDEYVSLEEKKILYEELKALNFDVNLHEISEKDIDHKFIKDLNHGMGIPTKLLIKKELPSLLDKILLDNKKDFKDRSISYPSEDLVYTFSEYGDRINLKITNIKK